MSSSFVEASQFRPGDRLRNLLDLHGKHRVQEPKQFFDNLPQETQEKAVDLAMEIIKKDEGGHLRIVNPGSAHHEYGKIPEERVALIFRQYHGHSGHIELALKIMSAQHNLDTGWMAVLTGLSVGDSESKYTTDRQTISVIKSCMYENRRPRLSKKSVRPEVT